MEKNELPPKLKAYHEQEVKRLEELAYELEDGVILIDRKTRQVTRDVKGWKTLEKELREDGVDFTTLAVSKWTQFKTGLRKFLSPNFRAKMNEYQEELEAWKSATEDLKNSVAWLKEPKKTQLSMEADLARLRATTAGKSQGRPMNVKTR